MSQRKNKKLTSSYRTKLQRQKQAALLGVIDATLRQYAQSEEGKLAFLEQHKDSPKVLSPVTERFAPGIYLREITMPAGSVICGKRHKTEHFNIILKGSVRCIDEEGNAYTLAAPYTFVSKAGMRKMFAVLSECVWQTIHPNPGEVRETAALEQLLIDPQAALQNLSKQPALAGDAQ